MSALIKESKYQTLTRGQLLFMAIYVIPMIISIATSGPDNQALGAMSIVASLVVVPNLFYSWTKTFTTVRVFEDRVEVLNSFLLRKSKRIEASKIESLDFSQSFLGRSRYGKLTVRGAGAGAITVSPIKFPEEMSEAIRGIADKSSSKIAETTSYIAPTDSQALAELIRMKEMGHLTDEEFSAAKNKLFR
jgi:hypothetical protein